MQKSAKSHNACYEVGDRVGYIIFCSPLNIPATVSSVHKVGSFVEYYELVDDYGNKFLAIPSFVVGLEVCS